MKKKYNTHEELLAARREKTKQRSFQNTVLKEKFIERIPISGCWIWTGQCWDAGYGYLRLNRKHIAAHRYMYEIYKGAFDKGLNVLHRCDNPSCVNPEHLFLGTQSDNLKDAYRKGRRSNKGKQNPNYKHGNYIGDMTHG